MSNEYSELQAVDFGLGAFIAAAFADLNAQVGPKEYREYLGRPTNRQIYRHDASTPEEFLKAYRSAQAGAKTAGGAKVNLVELPLIYYFRKPGLTNGTDKEMTRRGRFMFSDEQCAYKFIVIPLVIDYKLFFLAWDKPTLDKLQLAWYAYTSRNDKFMCRYQIGNNGDVFEVSAYLQDHKSLLCADESIAPGQDMSRVYAVSTGLQIATDVLFGTGVSVPEEIVVHGVLSSYISGGGGVSVPTAVNG